MSGPSATENTISAKIAVNSSITWLSGWTRPCSAGASRSGSVTSMVSEASRASSAADFRISRRSASACATLSLARLIAAPCVLRSSGDILPSVASRAEIDPFLPSAATRTAPSAASLSAAATCVRIWDSSWARSDMGNILWPGRFSQLPLARHARPCAGHPRLTVPPQAKTWMAGTSPAMTALDIGADGDNLCRERSLGLLGNRLERRGLIDREIREHLAVHGDAGLGQAVDETAVGHAERAHRGIEALDPECAEGALPALAIAECVLAGLFDRLLGSANGILAAAVIALGGLEDFLVLGVSGHTAFDARHDGNP